MKKLLLSLVITSGLFSMANAQIININLTSGNGGNPNVALNGTASSSDVAPIAYTGLVWNDIGVPALPGGATNLVDSNGNITTVGLQRTDAGGNSGAGFGFSFSGGPTAGADVVDNYLAATNGFGPPLAGPLTFEITGLSTTDVHNITFISQGDTSGQGADITINGLTLTSTGEGPTSAFNNGVNFVTFNNVTTGTGTVTFLLAAPTAGSAPNAGFAVLNGIQIDTVPEPTSAALLLGSGALLLFRRRRIS